MTARSETVRSEPGGWGLRAALAGLEHLAGGLGTALLAVYATVVVLGTGLLCLVGIGIPLIRPALGASRMVANRERARLNRWAYDIIVPYQADPRDRRELLRDPATWRDLGWLGCQASMGLLLGLIGVLLPVLALRDTSYPLWWRLLPAGQAGASLGFPASTWPEAISVGMMGIGWIAIIVGLGHGMARLQALPGDRLLRAHSGVDLSGRIVELTATRAAALEAHTAELRRIERSLHDGVQNRLVGILMLMGAARQANHRDTADADAILDRAQTAAEEVLAELRAVIRGILPPVLENKGLAGAVAALAAGCAVPCRLEVDLTGRCATSVEATAYFAVAEALTNVARHSGASSATVAVRHDGELLRVRIEDDGRGGATEDAGTGILGIQRRVAAHDGRFALRSPVGGPTTIDIELSCGT